MSYQELSIEEHLTIQLGQLQGLSQRAIARMLKPSPLTISRELSRNAANVSAYSASQAHQQRCHRRKPCRPTRKLEPGSELFYDQGREMARHAEITQCAGVAVYFCDPHSPWQCGSNENINGLIRQYLPKGTDLSGHSQEQLDAITCLSNIWPRQRLITSAQLK